MNIIQIVSDTFRCDFLGCYGNDWIHTEHIDAFAKESLVFDKAYIASFPTIPHRHDLFTGRYTFTYSKWDPLSRNEVILSQRLRQGGYRTMLIVDTPHMINNGFNFDRGFDGWCWIRNVHTPRQGKSVSSRKFEEDYFAAQTMTAAVKWLEHNYDKHEKFFLDIDTFDPHEPWDPPKWYAKMYDPDWKDWDWSWEQRKKKWSSFRKIGGADKRYRLSNRRRDKPSPSPIRRQSYTGRPLDWNTTAED